MTPLLSVRNLRISFPTPVGPVEVVKGLSFDLAKQERLGIVGESGSGKSMTGRAILKLVRSPGRQSADRLSFDGIDLAAQTDRQMRAIRGARISMIMQDPKFSLHPVMTVGRQIAEALRVHERLPRRDVQARVIEMMLIPKPDLLIADEPTSALDVSVQAQVLSLIDELVTGEGMGLILISHDLNLVARYCDRILVMNAGDVVEDCKAGALHRATHPYTRGLLAAQPAMEEHRETLPVLDRSQWGGT